MSQTLSKRIGSRSGWSPTLAGLSFLLLLLPSAACQGPAGQFFIVHNKVPQDGCVIPADEASPYRGDGVLDIRVPAASPDAAYFMFPLLSNQLPAEKDEKEQNRIFLSAFDVDLRVASGPEAASRLFADLAADGATSALLRYRTPWSGSVGPGGFVSASVNVFPVELANRLRQAGAVAGGTLWVEASVRAIGSRNVGTVESDTFKFPIQVCDGCLIRSVFSCPAAGTIAQGNACNPAQDAPVDCCSEGDRLICPATVGTP